MKKSVKFLFVILITGLQIVEMAAQNKLPILPYNNGDDINKKPYGDSISTTKFLRGEMNSFYKDDDGNPWILDPSVPVLWMDSAVSFINQAFLLSGDNFRINSKNKSFLARHLRDSVITFNGSYWNSRLDKKTRKMEMFFVPEGMKSVPVLVFCYKNVRLVLCKKICFNLVKVPLTALVVVKTPDPVKIASVTINGVPATYSTSEKGINITITNVIAGSTVTVGGNSVNVGGTGGSGSGQGEYIVDEQIRPIRGWANNCSSYGYVDQQPYYQPYYQRQPISLSLGFSYANNPQGVYYQPPQIVNQPPIISNNNFVPVSPSSGAINTGNATNFTPVSPTSGGMNNTGGNTTNWTPVSPTSGGMNNTSGTTGGLWGF